MRDQREKFLTIWPASFTRRTSLLALGSVALAATARSSPAAAGKAKKKAKKRCKRQIGQCESAMSPACADPELVVSQEECRALLLPCCQEFGDCQADAAFTCLIEASQAMAPPPP